MEACDERDSCVFDVSARSESERLSIHALLCNASQNAYISASGGKWVMLSDLHVHETPDTPFFSGWRWASDIDLL